MKLKTLILTCLLALTSFCYSQLIQSIPPPGITPKDGLTAFSGYTNGIFGGTYGLAGLNVANPSSRRTSVAVFANKVGNTGNGTAGTITITQGTAIGGIYTFTATSATNFTAVDPKGSSLTALTVGSAYSAGGIAFTVTAGGTAYVSGDIFTVTVPTNFSETIVSYHVLTMPVTSLVIAYMNTYNNASANFSQPAQTINLDVTIERMSSTLSGFFKPELGNTGNGTSGSVTVTQGITQGYYIFTATSATNFTGLDPKGNSIATMTVGTAYSSSGIGFTITAGSVAYIAGDVLKILISPSSNHDTPRRRVHFSGSASTGVLDGRAILYTDPIPFNGAQGEGFFLRTSVTVPNGNTYYGYGGFGTLGGARFQTSAIPISNGEALDSTGNYVDDGSANLNTAVGTLSTPAFGPVAIYGAKAFYGKSYKQLTLGGVGCNTDSIGAGTGDDTFGVQRGGYFEMACIAAGIPYLKASVGSTKASDWQSLTTNYLRDELLSTTVGNLIELGTNDITGSNGTTLINSNQGTLEANIVIIAARTLSRYQKVLLATILPKASSTNGFLDITGQTKWSLDGSRIHYNDWAMDMTGVGTVTNESIGTYSSLYGVIDGTNATFQTMYGFTGTPIFTVNSSGAITNPTVTVVDPWLGQVTLSPAPASGSTVTVAYTKIAGFTQQAAVYAPFGALQIKVWDWTAPIEVNSSDVLTRNGGFWYSGTHTFTTAQYLTYCSGPKTCTNMPTWMPFQEAELLNRGTPKTLTCAGTIISAGSGLTSTSTATSVTLTITPPASFQQDGAFYGYVIYPLTSSSGRVITGSHYSAGTLTLNFTSAFGSAVTNVAWTIGDTATQENTHPTPRSHQLLANDLIRTGNLTWLATPLFP